MFTGPIGSMYGIYANIGGILMVNVTIYSSTMDPVGEGRSPSVAFFWTFRMGEIHPAEFTRQWRWHSDHPICRTPPKHRYEDRATAVDGWIF
jgi:hypothetical protein